MAETYLGKLGEAPVVMLIGPIEHWWNENWNTAEHWRYYTWREQVNDALVNEGFLVYRPHEAFKGTWNNKMQEVNNYVLKRVDFVVNLRPEGIPSTGTDEELDYAYEIGKRVFDAPPPLKGETTDAALVRLINGLKKELDKHSR